MNQLYCYFLFLLLCDYTFAQNFNRPVSKELFSYEFKSYQSTPGYYYLTTPFKLGASAGSLTSYPVILDDNGYVFWYLKPNGKIVNDFRFFRNDSTWGFIESKQGSSWYKILDKKFELIDSITNVSGIQSDAHEFLKLANGNIIIGGEKDSVMDLSAYTFGSTQGSVNTVVKGYVLQEFNNAHQLLFEWNSNDFIHPSEAYTNTFPYNASGFDYCHGNSIELDTDSNLIISFRHLNAIYKISHKTGAVLWKLGGKSSSFTFTNDDGFSGQHDARRLPNGNISLFDNANSASNPKQSRGVEYQIDTTTWQTTKVWEYSYVSPFFARAMGNNQSFLNGYHLINYGFCFRPNPSFVFIDKTDQLISELFFPDSVMSYRSFAIEMPIVIQRPDISCSTNGDTLVLNAPDGFSEYQWSTGQHTQAISITTPGEYQVWVNYGAGMLGSLPFTVQHIQQACITGIEKSISSKQNNEMITGWFNLLGQRIDIPEQKQLYIIRYASGKSKLVMWRPEY